MAYFVLMCYGHSISSTSLTSTTNTTLDSNTTQTHTTFHTGTQTSSSHTSTVSEIVSRRNFVTVFGLRKL